MFLGRSYNYAHSVPSQQSTGIFRKYTLTLCSEHSIKNEPNSMVFLELTVGLIYDLGLNKQHPAEVQIGDMMSNTSTKEILERSEMNRTLDDRRALLSCYLLSTL